MPKQSGPSKLSYEELWGQVLARAVEADQHAADRLNRIWNAVTRAPCAADIHPVDQVLAVLSLLDAAGVHTPGIDTAQLNKYRRDSRYAKSDKSVSRT